MGIGLTAVYSYQRFNDDADIAEYASDAVTRTYTTGIIGGKPNNIFAPNDQATRAEASAMLRRFYSATA